MLFQNTFSFLLVSTLLLTCLSSFTLAVISKLSVYEEFGRQGESVSCLKHHADISCVLNTTKSYCMLGMWQVYSSVTGRSDFAHRPNEYCADWTQAWLQQATSVRHLAAADTSVRSLSLYEGVIDFYVPFGREHYFEGEWTGESFPTRALALTGWSIWTLYENANFQGTAWCLRATQQFQYVVNLNASYPSRVSSVAPGCDTKALHVIDIPMMT